jgi:hypothetical protein
MKTLWNWTRCAALLGALALLGAGCSGKSEPAKDADKRAGDKKDAGGKDQEGDDHPDEGPHGGALAEWDHDRYHAEFTVDHKEKKATVYILDRKAKKAVPIDAQTVTVSLANVKPPAVITLKADPQEDDPKGKSSRFSGTHDALGKEMEFEGEISGKVGDKPYAAEFKEEGHGGHKHDDKK